MNPTFFWGFPQKISSNRKCEFLFTKLDMSKKEENFRELIEDQNEAYEELLAQDIAHRESFAALERRMGHADDLLGPEPDFQEEGIVVIRIYTPAGCYRRRFVEKSPDRLLNAIHLYLESLGHLEEDTSGNLKTFDSAALTSRDLEEFLAKGGGAVYLNKRPTAAPKKPH